MQQASPGQTKQATSRATPRTQSKQPAEASVPQHLRSFNRNKTYTMAEGTKTQHTPWRPNTSSNSNRQYTMATIPHSRSGNANSQRLGLQDPFYPRMLDRAPTSTQHPGEADLRPAAPTTYEADNWIQLGQNLHILISITTAAATTIRLQHQHEIGLEIFRQIRNKFSIPTWRRSIGPPTRLLKLTFATNHFEESFLIGNLNSTGVEETTRHAHQTKSR